MPQWVHGQPVTDTLVHGGLNPVHGGLGPPVHGSANAFSPLDVFAGGQQGIWIDPSDLSSMFQTTDTSTPAVVNQPVGRINDKSGNGLHLTQATGASRPTLRQSGSKYYLEFDGVDDALFQAGIPLGVSTDLTWSYHNSGGALNYMLADSAASIFQGVAQDGNGAIPGLGSYTVNGVALAPNTRDALQDVIGSAGPKVIQVAGADMSGWGNFRISSFGGFLLSGRLYGLVVHTGGNALSRSNLQAYMASKAGI